MGPKSEDTPFQKPITVYWSTNGWRSDQNLDPDTQAWMMEFLENFLSQADVWQFDTVSNVESELRDLEALDAQVQGDHHPEALAWILNCRG